MAESATRGWLVAAAAGLLVPVVWFLLQQSSIERPQPQGNSASQEPGINRVQAMPATPEPPVAPAPPSSATRPAGASAAQTSADASAPVADERPTLGEYQARFSASASDIDSPDHLRNLLAIAEIDPSGESEIIAARMIFHCEAFLEPELQSEIGSKVEQGVLEAGGGNGEVQKTQNHIQEITARCQEVLEIADGQTSWELLDRAVAKGNHFAAAEINKGIYQPRDIDTWEPQKKQAEQERRQAQLLKAREACELHAFEVLADRDASTQSSAIEVFANAYAKNLVIRERFQGGDSIAARSEQKLSAAAQRIQLSAAELEQARALGNRYFDSYCQ